MFLLRFIKSFGFCCKFFLFRNINKSYRKAETMKLNAYNTQNNIQASVQVKQSNVSNTSYLTAPTQTQPQHKEEKVSSAASHSTTNPSEALKAKTLVQMPVSYKFVREIKIPFSNNAKLFQLANGQRVVVVEKKGPTVLETYFNVGSMNEHNPQQGISHFIEHMAFNGSKSPSGKTLGAGEFFKTVNEMGAGTNASTGFSQTDYFISSQLLGSNIFDKTVFIQSQQLQYPEHSEAMIEKEKGPVTSEISMVGDQTENIALSNCVKNLFQIKSTSSDLVAGSIENINNLNRDKTLEYYNLWYTPDNCSTVVTGEIPTQEAINTIAKHFNKFANVDTSKRKYQKFNTINSPVRVDVKMPKADSSTIVLGFAGPANNSTKENIEMEVLMTALMGYKNARINKELDKIHSGAMMNIERVGNQKTAPKAILLMSKSSPEKSESVIKSIYNEINRLSYEPVTQEEIDTAKKILKMTFSKVSENSHLLNMLLGNALLDDDLDYVENYLTILDSITPQDISNFARKFLDLNKASLSVVHPQNLDDKAIEDNYKKANQVNNLHQKNPSFSRKISFKGLEDEKHFDISKVKEYKLANNMEVVLNSNKSDISTASITLKTVYPAKTNPVVPVLLSVLLNEGSKTQNKNDFYKDLYASGINLQFDADFQTINATVESLYQDTDTALKKIKEVFNEPRLNEENFDYAKQIAKESLANMPESAMSHALRHLFPDSEEFATKQEMIEALEKTSLKDVADLFNYIKENSMAKAVFTAPFEKSLKLEQTIINELSANLGAFKPFTREVNKNYTPLQKDIIVTNVEPRNQADIVQAFKFKTNYNPKDQVVFRILNTILGDGSSSRLFNDLREEQKLAYRVESNLDFSGDSGIITLGIKTTTDDKSAGVRQFDNVKKSLDGFKKHVDKLKNEKVSQEELTAAKLRLKTKLLNSIETSDSQTTVLDRSKDSFNGISNLNENLKLIDTITAEDIQNAARYMFAGNSVISVLASEDTIKNCGLNPEDAQPLKNV